MDLEKSEKPEIKLPTSVGSLKRQESSRKTIHFCFIDYVKAFDCVDYPNCFKFLEMGIPWHLMCLLRNMYAGQEATVRTRHGMRDWFQIGKGVCQGCILSLCLFNLYAEYIMWNACLDEGHAGIKIAWRNINHLRYTEETNFLLERKWRGTKELLDKSEREEWKSWLKTQHSKS